MSFTGQERPNGLPKPLPNNGKGRLSRNTAQTNGLCGGCRAASAPDCPRFLTASGLRSVLSDTLSLELRPNAGSRGRTKWQPCNVSCRSAWATSATRQPPHQNKPMGERSLPKRVRSSGKNNLRKIPCTVGATPTDKLAACKCYWHRMRQRLMTNGRAFVHAVSIFFSE